MSDTPTTPSPAERFDGAPIRLKPSRNQKQRSRLNQAPEEGAAAEPQPEPAPPPPPAPPAAEPQQEHVIRRMRLRRSGQTHEDLTPPAETPRREDEY